MVLRLSAQDCADTMQDRSRDAGWSWTIQDLIHRQKACATAAISCGNNVMISWYPMYDLNSNSACSGALCEVACRVPWRPSNKFLGGCCQKLPAGRQKGYHNAGTRTRPSFDLARGTA